MHRLTHWHACVATAYFLQTCLTLPVLSLQDHHAFWWVSVCTVYPVVKSTSLEACCCRARLYISCSAHHTYICDITHMD